MLLLFLSVSDPCSLAYTDTGCSENADCVSDTASATSPNVYQCQCQSGFNDASVDATSPSTLVQSGITCESKRIFTIASLLQNNIIYIIISNKLSS